MRVAPLACITTNLERLVEDARSSARPTHLHPLGQDGAVVQAIAVWSALHSDPRAPLDGNVLLDRITAHVGAPEYREKLVRVGELASTATPERAAVEIGNGTAAAASVPTAVLAFLRHPDSFVDAVTFATRVSGDTDTIAAMTGAIAGARHGIAAIPQSWRDRLENFPTLHDLATRLGRRLGEQHLQQQEDAGRRHA
jgi:poly(ADP-ribose) glycohydrolase ARH3